MRTYRVATGHWFKKKSKKTRRSLNAKTGQKGRVSNSTPIYHKYHGENVPPTARLALELVRGVNLSCPTHSFNDHFRFLINLTTLTTERKYLSMETARN